MQEAVESCNSPTLRAYSTQRPKFQKDFDVLCQHLEPLLKDTPKLSATEELQCWFVLVELERERCLKAWKAFYKVYKEECKAEDQSQLSNFDFSEATESVYNVFVDSLDALRERVDDFLECADRLSGVHLLAQIPFRILWDEEEDLSMLLEMREAVGQW
ncbi:hypothetical protein [Helicobacter bizzozeronii]|uniref:hypothetical protein n=1 Tax=Helicobacter bizzozeronii TaxID=56877 RepID=UPI000CEEDC0B|nr:hypothetical protein [Helicobacter bizzozeronii]